MSDLVRYPFFHDGIAQILACPAGVARDTGVLLCRPWGHDEVCSRKFYKILADAIAEAGFPTLRFDYPSTVDSIDPDTDHGLDTWMDAADKSADLLRKLGCKRIVVFGLAFGTVIAHHLVRTRKDLLMRATMGPVSTPASGSPHRWWPFLTGVARRWEKQRSLNRS